MNRVGVPPVRGRGCESRCCSDRAARDWPASIVAPCTPDSKRSHPLTRAAHIWCRRAPPPPPRRRTSSRAHESTCAIRDKQRQAATPPSSLPDKFANLNGAPSTGFVGVRSGVDSRPGGSVRGASGAHEEISSAARARGSTFGTRLGPGNWEPPAHWLLASRRISAGRCCSDTGHSGPRAREST
jgi:hypothetical protein